MAGRGVTERTLAMSPPCLRTSCCASPGASSLVLCSWWLVLWCLATPARYPQPDPSSTSRASLPEPCSMPHHANAPPATASNDKRRGSASPGASLTRCVRHTCRTCTRCRLCMEGTFGGRLRTGTGCRAVTCPAVAAVSSDGAVRLMVRTSDGAVRISHNFRRVPERRCGPGSQRQASMSVTASPGRVDQGAAQQAATLVFAVSEAVVMGGGS